MLKKPINTDPAEKNQSPISELKEILDEAGPDIPDLFGAALTIFAGPSAHTKEAKEKLADLERMIRK